VVEYVFTFGGAHRHPVEEVNQHLVGKNLGQYFVVREVPEHGWRAAEETRCWILNRFGNGWSFQYESREKAGVERYGLIELTTYPEPSEVEEFYVDNNGTIHLRKL